MNKTTHKCDSSEQRRGERTMVASLSYKLRLKLDRRRILMPDGSRTDVDGVADSPFVLCEAWAHHGRAKGSQLKKPLDDAFKMLYIERILKLQARKILLFCDDDAANSFRNTGWRTAALKAFGIEIHVVEICDELRREIRAAQDRQVMISPIQ